MWYVLLGSTVVDSYWMAKIDGLVKFAFYEAADIAGGKKAGNFR
jgi:hypothetical protein